MRYQPIEKHGIVGNMHSAALVSLEGSVDWLCLPRFDSPSVFGAILDADKGGASGSPRPAYDGSSPSDSTECVTCSPRSRSF
jgi:GH15 family glucan-1,4-alpha-glucosidase